MRNWQVRSSCCLLEQAIERMVLLATELAELEVEDTKLELAELELAEGGNGVEGVVAPLHEVQYVGATLSHEVEVAGGSDTQNWSDSDQDSQ